MSFDDQNELNKQTNNNSPRPDSWAVQSNKEAIIGKCGQNCYRLLTHNKLITPIPHTNRSLRPAPVPLLLRSQPNFFPHEYTSVIHDVLQFS